MTYISVGLAAFLAATIFPFYSEIAVGAAVLAGYSVLGIWVAASLGNTLGAALNGILGRLLSAESARNKLRISDKHYTIAKSWFQRYGVYSLLLSWLPVVGDVLTVIAGILRVPWAQFVALVFIGKSVRYAVLIWLILAAKDSAA